MLPLSRGKGSPPHLLSLSLSLCAEVICRELSDIEPNIFLRPFLEVVRSEDTTGPITGLALTSVNKFLSYGLIGKMINPRTGF
ncbi:Golgi-specific brefeldin A-resistance guanine nucleotide exchange factor 1-like [Solea senegalensis]|uniref:Golgi-specific brefeldin A-resistance guanine nucleotide exchange factor 1-like n=1 Tax=Solea senegalensis TaxID=28829 RepID=A0AAV6PS43_SOLSE|nr:Golgi-specific brefeldin A-resistance guanine nucleotide exchange factor 1-like [Solea senegalensis]